MIFSALDDNYIYSITNNHDKDSKRAYHVQLKIRNTNDIHLVKQ